MLNINRKGQVDGGSNNTPKPIHGKLTEIAKKLETKGQPKKDDGAEPNSKKQSVSKDATKRGGGVVAASKLRDCKFCGRPFTFDRIEIHEVICQRSLKNKKNKKPFIDPKDVNKTVKGQGNKSKNYQLPPPPNWKEAHDQLLASFQPDGNSSGKRRTSMDKTTENLTKLPPPPEVNPDYVQCPHCGRRFNKEAAQRHIPQCKDYNYNKK